VDQFPRRGVFVRTIVVVASRAGWRIAVFAISMTVAALNFPVGFVQIEAGDHMTEIPLIPAGMAGHTLIIQAADLLAGGMASAAIQLIVKPVERPPGFGVGEGGFFFGIMAFGALVGFVAVAAHRVDFGLSPLAFLGGLQVMAIGAVFVLVTTDALQAEQFNMFLVEESHDRSLRIGRPVDFGGRGRDNGMGCSHDVRRVGRRGRHSFARLRDVTDGTLGVMAPLAVTTEALTVVRSLEARLPKCVGAAGRAVTLLARGDFPGGGEVVAGLAVGLHFGHARMNLVVKMHGAVQVGDFIKNYHRGSFSQLMFDSRLVSNAQGWAGLEAHILSRGRSTRVALKAIEFGKIAFLRLSADGICERKEQREDNQRCAHVSQSPSDSRRASLRPV
jgi:hypothetical protein